MNQEEINILMEKIDRKCKLPKKWNEFIEKETIEHNLLVKDAQNKKIYCTHCHHNFYDTKYQARKYKKCPNCKKEFLIVSINGYMPEFRKSVVYLQRMEKQVIIRVFEILSNYNIKLNDIETDIQEYCRIIPGKGRFISDAVRFYMYTMRIYHYDNNRTWSQYNGCRYFSEFSTYPYKPSRLIKGTRLEYAPIKEFCNRFKRYNFIDVVELAGYESFELLWKMGLYNLSLFAKKLNKTGTFYQRFGVTKNHYNFMKEEDINYRQLQLLRVLKVDDIKVLNEYYHTSINSIKFWIKEGILELIKSRDRYLYSYNIKTFKELRKYIQLKNLFSYKQGLDNLYIYKDYLEMADKLALNYKSKEDLFPKDLISRHDKLQVRMKNEKNQKEQQLAYSRYLELSKYTYEDDKFIIFPAPSVEALKEEGRQQGNCVGNLYLDKYINAETEIFFIRNKKKMSKSLITLEYKNSRITQRELAHHKRDFTQEQEEFMKKWEQYRNFMSKKEKYQSKVIRYDIKAIAA